MGAKDANESENENRNRDGSGAANANARLNGWRDYWKRLTET
jgi:hypothetical protein